MEDSTPQVYLDRLAFNIERYQKSDQAVFGPRFGSGATDETDLTLLKTATFIPTMYGSFDVSNQNDLIPFLIKGRADYANNVMVSAFKPNTVVTTPIPNALGIGKSHQLTAYIIWKGETIFAIRIDSKNYLFRYGFNRTITAITVPASGADTFHTSAIRSFGFKDDVLYIASVGGPGIWYLNSSYTLVKVPASSSAYRHLFNLNSRMYDLSNQGVINEYTGTTAAQGHTFITSIYDADEGASSWTGRPIAVLNGRAYIGIKRGLWAFDGVRTYEVINSSALTSVGNFTFLTACAGYLYFNKGRSLYRFNGVSIEKIYDFPKDTYFQKAVNIDDDLYISTFSYDDDEISLKFDEAPTPFEEGGRIYRFDGNLMHLLDDIEYNVSGKGADIDIMGSIYGIVQFGFVYANASVPTIAYANEYTVPRVHNDGYESNIPITGLFQSFDFGLPSVSKYIHSIQFEFLQDLDLTTDSDSIDLYYREDESTAWALVHTFGSSYGNLSLYRADLDTPILDTRRGHFRIEIGGRDIQFRAMTLFYYIKTPYRGQWNMTLNPAVNTLYNENGVKNLVVDPSFELGTDGWSMLGVGGTVVGDGDTFRSGENSLGLYTAPSGNQQAGYLLTGLFVGVTYHFKAYVRASSAGKDIYMQSSIDDYAVSINQVSTGDWDLIEGSFVSLYNEGTFELGVFSNSDVLYVDDVIITRSTEFEYTNDPPFTDLYLSKLEALRTSQDLFNFVDLDQGSHTVMLDSFTQNINPVYSPDGVNPFESQFTVVLREV